MIENINNLPKGEENDYFEVINEDGKRVYLHKDDMRLFKRVSGEDSALSTANARVRELEGIAAKMAGVLAQLMPHVPSHSDFVAEMPLRLAVNDQVGTIGDYECAIEVLAEYAAAQKALGGEK